MYNSTTMMPPRPANSPARSESLPMVAEIVWTDCGVKRTGREPYLSTSASCEAWELVKGLLVEPLITAVPLKLAAWIVGADSTTPSSSKASRLEYGGLL